MFKLPDADNDTADVTWAGAGADADVDADPPDSPSSGGCLKEQFGLRQFPPSQYQQSLGLILALSLCLYSQSLPVSVRSRSGYSLLWISDEDLTIGRYPRERERF